MVTYTPWTYWGGTEDLTYIVADALGATNSGVIHATSAPNNPPVAVADTVFARPAIAKTFDPRINDSDPDHDGLTIYSVGAPSHGAVVINSGGTLTYTAQAGYLGLDSFAYTIRDGRGGSATAQISVTVQPNQPPVAVDDQVTAPPSGGLTFDPRVNDSDFDGDALTIISVGPTGHGTVSIGNSATTLTYRPSNGYTGADSFSYTISDGYGGTATATVSVNVAFPTRWNISWSAAAAAASPAAGPAAAAAVCSKGS